ncbi:MAG: glycosylase [Kiritimatiellales bacterium]
MSTIIGENVPNMPWQERPEGCSDPVWRYDGNPIIARHPTQDIHRCYNSAAVPFEGKFIGVFRCEGSTGWPRLSLGRSENGIDWVFDKDPIQFVQEDGSPYTPGYTYDPRLLRIGDEFYIVFCNEFHGPTIGLATTSDFKTFIFIENAFIPFNRNGVLFPRKINDSYLLLSRPSDSGHTPFGDIFLSRSHDLVHWGRHQFVMGATKNDWWQNLKIGAGPAPIETVEGWILFYHGVCNTCNGYVYSMGAALLDLNDPSIVLGRTPGYLLTPELQYECMGQVPNVIFPCAAIADAQTGRIAVYYGAADTYSALAFCYVDELLSNLKSC